MNKVRLISIVLAAACCLSLSLGARERYENVREGNLWLRSTNVVGMRADTLSASVAALKGSFETGEYRLYNDAPLLWGAGAEASSIKHLRKFSLAGTFGFTQTTLYNACGSMFGDPGRFPVDISEYTPGTKSRQKYYFDGAISVDLSSSWRIGGDVSFAATNTAKRKDLRYTDYAMDFHIAPSLQWLCGADGALGVSFILERNTETITAEQIGESSTSYYAFLDKGLFYGQTNVWDAGSLHISEPGISGFPVRKMGYGAALQGSWRNVFAEFSYVRRSGTVGEKDAIWFTFPANDFAAAVSSKILSSDGAVHVLRLDASYSRENLCESIIEKVTEGGVTTRSNYGSNTVLRRSSLSVAPSWSAWKDGCWEMKASLGYSREEGLGSQMYPWCNTLTLRSACASFDVRLISGGWSGIMRAALRKGWIQDAVTLDSSYDTDVVEALSFQARNEDIFDAWKDYNAALSYMLGMGLRRDFSNGLFLQADASCRVGGSLWRLSANLTFGYEF